MACVEKGSFGVFKKHLELPHCAKRGGGGKFKSGGGVGSLFIRINGSFTLKAVKFCGYIKKTRNYIVYV